MRAAVTKIIAIIVISMASATVHAQKTTEQFIPLGKSPGVSGVSSYIGKIAKVDATNRIITVADGTKSWSVAITETTNIWLDRSKYKKTNIVGRFEDLKASRQVEVKPEDANADRAEWIKVVPEAGQ